MKQFLLIMLCSITVMHAQKATIKGQVSGLQKKEPLAGVNIVVRNTLLGTNTSENGYYQLAELPASEITLIISHIGYAEKVITFNLKEDTTLNIDKGC